MGAAEMTAVTAFAGMRRVADVLFKAGCPDCRAALELRANALMLAIGATSRTTFYSFTCTECGSAVRKPAGERPSSNSSPAAGCAHCVCTPQLQLDLMFWPMFAIVVGFLGIAVLGVLAVRVFVEARRLGKQVTGLPRAGSTRRPTTWSGRPWGSRVLWMPYDLPGSRYELVGVSQ